MISPWVARMCGVRRSGFTLIEVLMATFIIGLGVLGLAALFAGAARQQQIATQTTNATLQSSNADALIGRNLGVISGTNLSVSGNRPDRIDAGVWYPIPTSNADDTLSIDFAQDGTRDGDLYFLVHEDQPAILYDRPTAIDQGFPIPAQGNILFNFDLNLGAFPRPQVDCGATDELRVIYSEVNDPTKRSAQVFRYASPCEIVGAGLTAIPVEWGFDQSWQADCQNDANDDSPGGIDRESQIIEQWSRGVFFPNGTINSTTWVVVDRGVTRSDGTQPPSRVMSARLPILQTANPTLQVERVDVPQGYSWRNERVISLQDRVLTRPDTASINGRRPDVGFALLYRRLSNGAGQVGVFTYQISAVDGQALRPAGYNSSNAPRDLFLPFEELSDFQPNTRRAPLREYQNVQLAYDRTEEAYYVIAPNTLSYADAGTLVEPGQLLLVKNRVDGNNVYPGADDAVRVLRRFNMPNGWPAGQLDRAPRAVGQSMLDDFDNTSVITVWAVQQTVNGRYPRNRLTRGALWKLEPLDFTVLQVE